MISCIISDIHPRNACDICHVLFDVTGYLYHSDRSPFCFIVIFESEIYNRYLLFHRELALCWDYHGDKQFAVSWDRAGTISLSKSPLFPCIKDIFIQITTYTFRMVSLILVRRHIYVGNYLSSLDINMYVHPVWFTHTHTHAHTHIYR